MTGEHAQHWEERYSSVDRLWSGRPNDWLPELAAAWSPGRALDIGCGEGADALWLAERGWRVTGVDLSATAIGRLLEEVGRRGLGGRVTARAHDVGAGLPEGPFDLVTSFYVHGGPQEGSVSLTAMLADAAARLAPGGRLLVVVHAVNPPWHTHHPRTYRAAELLGGIGPAVAGWAVEVCEERWQRATGPDGRSGRRADAIVCLRRAQATEAGSGA